MFLSFDAAEFRDLFLIDYVPILYISIVARRMVYPRPREPSKASSWSLRYVQPPRRVRKPPRRVRGGALETPRSLLEDTLREGATGASIWKRKILVAEKVLGGVEKVLGGVKKVISPPNTITRRRRSNKIKVVFLPLGRRKIRL